MENKFRIMRLLGIFCLILIFFAGGCQRTGGKLSSDEQRTWDNFLNKQLSTGMIQPNSEEASAVAALGDKIVPRIEKNLGKAYTGPGGKGDYWLVIVLTRIGTPRAVEGIVKILKHDYPGKIQLDREIAASALVWLGAIQAVPALKAVVIDSRKFIEQRLKEEEAKGVSQEALAWHRSDYGKWVEQMEGTLSALEQGQGKRDTTNFPFD